MNLPPQDKRDVARNIEDQAKWCQGLCIWTDCDREGEHIGHEICEAAKKGNNRLHVKRAKFSNIERAQVPHLPMTTMTTNPELGTLCMQRGTSSR